MCHPREEEGGKLQKEEGRRGGKKNGRLGGMNFKGEKEERKKGEGDMGKKNRFISSVESAGAKNVPFPLIFFFMLALPGTGDVCFCSHVCFCNS